MRNTTTRVIHRLVKILPADAIGLLFRKTNGLLPNHPLINQKLQKWYWDTTSSNWFSEKEPFRPSPNALTCYKNFIKEVVPKKNILLLGSTPEIRDLLSEWYGTSDIFLCDFSRKMVDSTTALLKQADANKEKRLYADWMSSAIPKNYFDTIIGDLPLLQFPPHDDVKFLRRINELLSPKGRFIIRCRIRKENLSEKKYADTIISYLSRHNDTGADNQEISRRILWSSFDYFTDAKTRKFAKNKARLALEQLIDSQPASSTMLNLALQKIMNTNNKFSFRWQWGAPSKSELTSRFQAVFAKDFHAQTSGEDETAEYIVYSLSKN